MRKLLSQIFDISLRLGQKIYCGLRNGQIIASLHSLPFSAPKWISSRVIASVYVKRPTRLSVQKLPAEHPGQSETDAFFDLLANEARVAAERAANAVTDALAYVQLSFGRIAQLENES